MVLQIHAQEEMKKIVRIYHFSRCKNDEIFLNVVQMNV